MMYTPCHTRGHVVYVITGPSGSPILCSGDTLFVGGCGRFFEGTADDMLKNMDRLAELPVDTLVCCAHEYTAANYSEQYLPRPSCSYYIIVLHSPTLFLSTQSSSLRSMPSCAGRSMLLFKTCAQPMKVANTVSQHA